MMDEVRVCPNCRRAHPVEVEVCTDCGEPLTTVSRVLDRQGSPNPPRWLRRARTDAAQIKERAARASEARMEHFLEIDRRRLQALAEQRAQQEERDRKLLLVTGSILGLFVLTLCLTGLFVLLRG